MPRRKSLDHLDCSVTNTADQIGDRWTLLILRDAFLGVRRFSDFRYDLRIARNVLSNRLDGLVRNGILMTRQYQDNPPRNEYLLTEKGKDLYDVMMTLWRWGDRWEPSVGERVATHTECGQPTYAVTTCSHCGEELTRSTTRFVPLPDVVIARLARSEGTQSR